MIKTYVPEDRFGSNMYLVFSDGDTVLIDPSTPPDLVRSDFFGDLPTVGAILLTHAHFDHMLEIDAWVRATGAPVYVGCEDATALSDPERNAYRIFTGEARGYDGAYRTVADGETLRISSLEICVLATPGHTPGSVTYRIGDIAFSGDLVFDGGGYGRCDLPGGDLRTLFSSIARLAAHREIQTLYPGHGSPFSMRHLAAQFRS